MSSLHNALSVLLLAVIASPLTGQQPTERTVEKVRPSYRVMVNGQDVTPSVFSSMQRRARLGVTVSLEARDSDARGADIESVTPGGPAAKAGLRSGDIVSKLGGQSVLDRTRKASPEESVPGLRLIELAAKLEPDDTITIEFYRGDALTTVDLVTGDEPIEWTAEGNVMRLSLPDGERVWQFPGLRFEPRVEVGPNEGLLGPRLERLELSREPGNWNVFMSRGGISSLELAPLDDDLGSYFGTTDGILVVRAPTQESLGLK
ncbi:MAG: PDZ domain-containing protein, partial [Gemmatimonadales bacterium]